LYAIVIIVEKIIHPSLSIGYASIFIAIIFFSGVQLIFMGLLGEYIGKILKNVNKEPQYSIDYIKLNEPKK
jgi:undecaprenyl-phosphate 4-deoxy-4-formamido-L-arabinose transferase